MWPGPRTTYMTSFILIHPAFWRCYTNVTDRTRHDKQTGQRDRQRSDSIGRSLHLSTYVVLRCGLIITSGQSNLTTDRIAAEHGRFNGISQVVPLCTSRNTCCLWLIRIQFPNGISIFFSCLLHGSPQSVIYAYFTMGRSKLPVPMGDSGPHVIHGSLCPPDFSTQTAFRSVQQFLQSSLPWHTDRPRSV